MHFLKTGFASLGIRNKVLIAPLLMLVVMVGTGIYALGSLNTLDGRVQYIAGDLAPGTEAATELMQAMYHERLAVDTFLRNAQEANLEAWQRHHRTTRDRLAAADAAFAAFADSDRRAILAQAGELHATYAGAFAEQAAPRRLEINRIQAEELEPAGHSVRSRANNLMQLAYGAHELDVGDLAGQVARDVLLTRLAVQDFLASADSTDEMQVRDLLELVTSNLELLEIMAYSNMVEAEALSALEEWRGYQDAFDRMVDLLYVSVAVTANELDPLGPRMTDSAAALQQHIGQELLGLAATTGEETRGAFLMQSLLTLFAAILGLACAWFVTRQVVGPLLRTNQRIDAMLGEIEAGHGDLGQRLEVESGDEIGQLTTNFNRFLATLQQVVHDLAQGTGELASAAEELSAVTSQTSAGIQRQNGETDQVATAITQMAATVQEIARNAAEASQAAADASESAGDGRGIVTATVTAIDRLVQVLETAGGSVDRLNDDVAAITRIVDVIQNVAEQTNLLALNAAIEAARAGEQGRGFAVVADEVRDLAQKTQSSTHEIQQLIETLQRGAAEAVEAMGEGRSQGQTTIEQAAGAGAALERIDRKVKAIDGMNAQIASAAEEQTATSNDISESVGRIRDVAAETAGGAEQTARSSEELARLGERLSRLVGRFRA